MSPKTELRDAANGAMTRAYAPYSNFRVGAALRTADGQVVTGCNVENAAYGEALCAERVALGAAVARGLSGFEELAIASDADEPAPPCGACRQVMSELAPKLRITSYARDGRQITWTLAELLPEPFVLSHLRNTT